jgi:hypothetical protein
MSVLAICIKETYTWEGDGKQHRFSKVKKGHCYTFDKIGDTYWIDPLLSANKEDIVDSHGFYDGVARGLREKYFKEMFKLV